MHAQSSFLLDLCLYSHLWKLSFAEFWRFYLIYSGWIFVEKSSYMVLWIVLLTFPTTFNNPCDVCRDCTVEDSSAISTTPGTSLCLEENHTGRRYMQLLGTAKRILTDVI